MVLLLWIVIISMDFSNINISFSTRNLTLKSVIFLQIEKTILIKFWNTKRNKKYIAVKFTSDR